MQTKGAGWKSDGIVRAATIAAVVSAIVLTTQIDLFFWSRDGLANNAEATEMGALDSVNLGVFTVNLANTRKVVQVDVSIKLDPDSFKEQLRKPGFARLTARTLERRSRLEVAWPTGYKSRRKETKGVPPYLELYIGRIRDSMIGTLSSKEVADLTEGVGRERLRDELLENLNVALGFKRPVIQELALNGLNIQESAFFRLFE